VGLEVIAKAFGLRVGTARRMVDRGEILSHGNKSRSERRDDLRNGVNIWETGMFGARVLRVLRRNGIHTVADLCRRKPEELLSFPGFGTRSLREVDQVLEEIGRRLGDMDDDLREEDERFGSEEQGGSRPAPTPLRSLGSNVRGE